MHSALTQDHTPTAAAGDNTYADLAAALYRERARDTPDRRRHDAMEPPEAPACAEPGDTVRTMGAPVTVSFAPRRRRSTSL